MFFAYVSAIYGATIRNAHIQGGRGEETWYSSRKKVWRKRTERRCLYGFQGEDGSGTIRETDHRKAHAADMLNPMGVAPQLAVDLRLPQSLGSLPDPLAVPAGEAPQISLEGTAYLH